MTARHGLDSASGIGGGELDRASASPLETAVGAALAIAFGAGARHGLEALVDAITGGLV